MVTALFALLIILEYEARIRDGCFAGRVILAVFAVTIFLDAAVATLLFKSRIFHRAGVWPPRPAKERP